MAVPEHASAVAHLKRADPVLKKIIAAVGPCLLEPGARGDHFTTLLRAICGQQLSAKAAESIWQRVLKAYGRGRHIAPDAILAVGVDELRATGLSASKVAFMKDLASRVESRELSFRSLVRRTDDEIVDELVRVKGIGRWTAEMFLIFKLGRPDVWPIDDLGIRNAVQRAWGVEASPATMRELAEPWRPWRSVATWYLWRSLALAPV